MYQWQGLTAVENTIMRIFIPTVCADLSPKFYFLHFHVERFTSAAPLVIYSYVHFPIKTTLVHVVCIKILNLC